MNDRVNEISICVGIKNKSFELFTYLISSMNKCIDKNKLSLSIFDCGSSDIIDLKKEIEKKWAGKLYFYSEKIIFTRSYSFNKAVKQTNANYVFLCDVDMTLPVDFIKQFKDNVNNSSVWFPICFSLARGKERKIDDNNGWWRDSGFGMVGIRKSLYIEMNGLNEEFTKWGGEDNDFYNRIKVTKKRNRCIGLYHNWHFSENNYRTTPKKFRDLLEDNIKLNIEKKNFSIIITAYNTKDFIEECLESIENQSYFKDNNNYEVLIGVDNCSETLEKVQQIRGKFRNIKVFYMKKNYGTYITSNSLLSLVKFDNIVRFDSDDIMFNNCIEELSNNLEYDIIRFKYKNFKNNDLKNSKLIVDCANGCIFYKKNIFERLGGYQDWICAADFELLTRCSNSNFKIFNFNKPLFYRRIHENSLTNNRDTNLKSKIREEYHKKIMAINNSSQIYIRPQIGEFEEISKNFKNFLQIKNFSIIISAYNTKDFIEECLESIENQTYFKDNNNYEVLIGIDNCFETLEKVQQIREKFRNIKVFYMEKNYGTYITANTLLSLTKFENIVRFDSDDIMFDNFIEELSKKLDYDIVQYRFKSFKLNKKTAILETNFFPGTVFYKKKIFEKLGGYQDWVCAADTELQKRFLKANFKVFNLETPLFYRRIHENSLTRTKLTGIGSKIRNEYCKKIQAIDENSPIFVKPVIGKFKEYLEVKDSKKQVIKVENNNIFSKFNCEIIIVVHNSLNIFKKCVESILRNTKASYSLTIVENNCNEETKKFIDSLKNIKVIRNDKNLGFGYCNNKAIRESQSNYICFLNSDTIVTPNWLENLIKNLDPQEVGFVGPVTNSVSSEFQLVKYNYSENYDSIENINCFSEQNTTLNKDKKRESSRLIGFCLLTKRSVLEKIGVFDERYEFNFEDDDLCLRAIEKGYKLYSILDTFVFHYGSTTFKQLPEKNKTDIYLEQSRKLFEVKWYLTNRVEKINNKNLDPNIIFLLASDSPCGGVKIVFEYANRLKDRGYNVKIYCENQYHQKWFNLYVPIIYYKEVTEIPQCDIAIGTYFTTLKKLQEMNALVKVHFCQGYEALLYDPKKPFEKNLIQTIEDNYTKIKDKIVISSWLKEMLDPKYAISSKLIQNGIDPYIFSFKRHDRNRIPRILVVGNYNLEIKGVRKVLEVLKGVSNKQIVRMASEKTKFDGIYEFYNMSKMSQEEIAKVYESCDITICGSSKVEGFSLPPLESMASGTPVITTDSGGVNEYAIHNFNCIIVSQDNKTSFLHWIKYLLDNNIDYNRIVDKGLETANNFLWYSKVDMLEEHLQSLYKNKIKEQKNSLSLCMIVKNEEENLERCLKSVEKITNEIIIVDTGSTDGTVSIAKKFGAKVYHFDWDNNFSNARNFALNKVTQKWVLILDADEAISSKDLEKIDLILKGPEIAYSFTTRNYVKSLNIEGVVPCTREYEEEGENSGWCPSQKVRLFPYSQKIQFEGEVHELVEKTLSTEGIEIKDIEIPIHHWGYLKEKGKQEVYLELGKKKIETVEEPKSLYELGMQYMSLNNFDEALVVWRKLLLKHPKNIIYMSRMGTTYNLLGDYKQAEKMFKEVIVIKDDEYTLKHLGICYAKQGKIQEAYNCFKKIVYTTEDLKTMADFSYCCNTLKKFDESISILEKSLKINRSETIRWGLLEIAYNEKGLLLAKKGFLVHATHMFKSALYINPNFDVARSNLNEIKKLLDKKKRIL